MSRKSFLSHIQEVLLTLYLKYLQLYSLFTLFTVTTSGDTIIDSTSYQLLALFPTLILCQQMDLLKHKSHRGLFNTSSNTSIKLLEILLICLRICNFVKNASSKTVHFHREKQQAKQGWISLNVGIQEIFPYFSICLSFCELNFNISPSRKARMRGDRNLISIWTSLSFLKSRGWYSPWVLEGWRKGVFGPYSHYLTSYISSVFVIHTWKNDCIQL